MTKTSKPSVLYGTRYNLAGLWSLKPVKFKYDPDSEKWWDRSGNLDCKGPGLWIVEGCVTFASVDEGEVRTFILGVCVAAHMAIQRLPCSTKKLDEFLRKY